MDAQLSTTVALIVSAAGNVIGLIVAAWQSSDKQKHEESMHKINMKVEQLEADHAECVETSKNMAARIRLLESDNEDKQSRIHRLETDFAVEQVKLKYALSSGRPNTELPEPPPGGTITQMTTVSQSTPSTPSTE